MNKRFVSLIGILVLVLIVLGIYRAGWNSSGQSWGIGLNGHSNTDGGSGASHAAVKRGNAVADFISAYQTPIEFYGKVVDQHGDPVAGASVRILPFDNAFGASKNQMMLTSDSAGRFSISGIKGLAMGVQVEKEGYLTISDLGFEKPASSRRIEYGLGGGKGDRFKDPSKPTIFTLHNLGHLEPVVYLKEENWERPWTEHCGQSHWIPSVGMAYTRLSSGLRVIVKIHTGGNSIGSLR